MIRGIYHSAAGMLPRYYQLVSVSNNLANATTTSFKADRRYFSTVLNNELVQPGAGNHEKRIEDLDKGLYTNFSQGAINSTGAKTDLALNGNGYFVVENPDTTDRFYTRDGRFRINNQGELVTALGYRVLDDSGSSVIIRDTDNFFIDDAGTIFVRGAQTTSLMLADFENRQDLIKKGDSMYQPKDPNVYPITPENSQVIQGSLEASNVDVVEEMVTMIDLNRNYESSQRALTAQDESLGKLINTVPRF
ncbi:MAG: flagellar basal-body rod protein FlgF [bacterium]